MNNDAKFPFSLYREAKEGRIINTRVNKSSMEILEVTSGTVKVQIGTDFVSAVRGDFLYVPPSMMLRVDAEGGYAAVRGIIFDISVFEANMENFDTEAFLTVLPKIQTFSTQVGVSFLSG